MGHIVKAWDDTEHNRQLGLFKYLVGSRFDWVKQPSQVADFVTLGYAILDYGMTEQEWLDFIDYLNRMEMSSVIALYSKLVMSENVPMEIRYKIDETAKKQIATAIIDGNDPVIAQIDGHREGLYQNSAYVLWLAGRNDLDASLPLDWLREILY